MSCPSKWLKPIKTRATAIDETELEEEEPLTPWARLFHAPRFNCCIIAVLGFKTKANVEAIRDGFIRDWTKHPRFSSKLVRFYFRKFLHSDMLFLICVYNLVQLLTIRCLLNRVDVFVFK